MPCSLRTRYKILPSSGLHVATSWQPVTESLRVEVCRRVVHILAASTVLPGRHQLIVDAACTSSWVAALSSLSTLTALTTMLVACLTLLIYHVHPVEVILGQV